MFTKGFRQFRRITYTIDYDTCCSFLLLLEPWIFETLKNFNLTPILRIETIETYFRTRQNDL